MDTNNCSHLPDPQSDTLRLARSDAPLTKGGQGRDNVCDAPCVLAIAVVLIIGFIVGFAVAIFTVLA